MPQQVHVLIENRLQMSIAGINQRPLCITLVLRRHPPPMHSKAMLPDDSLNKRPIKVAAHRAKTQCRDLGKRGIGGLVAIDRFAGAQKRHRRRKHRHKRQSL